MLIMLQYFYENLKFHFPPGSCHLVGTVFREWAKPDLVYYTSSDKTLSDKIFGGQNFSSEKNFVT